MHNIKQLQSKKHLQANKIKKKTKNEARNKISANQITGKFSFSEKLCKNKIQKKHDKNKREF